MRTFTAMSSRIYNPCVNTITIDEQPVVTILEVVRERNSHRKLQCAEAQYARPDAIRSTSRLNLYLVRLTISQTIQFERHTNVERINPGRICRVTEIECIETIRIPAQSNSMVVHAIHLEVSRSLALTYRLERLEVGPSTEVTFAAVSAYVHVIGGFCLKAGEQERNRIGINQRRERIGLEVSNRIDSNLPCRLRRIGERPAYESRMSENVRNIEALQLQASRNDIQRYIVDMDIVVSTRNCRFTVESNLNILIIVSTEADSHRLTFCRACDIVIYILRTSVIPLTEDSPRSTLIGRNQYDELVILLLSCIHRSQGTRVLSQSHVEGQLVVGSQQNFRGYQPLVAACTIDIGTCMTIKYAIVCTKCPIGSGSKRYGRIRLQEA